MKKNILYIILWILIFACTPVFSQSQVNTVSGSSIESIIRMYDARKTMFRERIPELFAQTDTIESSDIAEAAKFLIAYAPLSDLGNLNAGYFRQMAEFSLLTKKEFIWGNSVPAEVFRHFVLPYRVNNENPDSARVVFFAELKERVKGLSMYEAALEVNHWCHEKVSYQSTDERTSAPLSTIKTAYGRCGEESTLTVSAMRSVGIPARQVYTPRWAHSDDNHAWVEVWVDGKWYFMGACEPDPELNMGWFAGPATRAIMMHTNTFGQYNGLEKTLMKTPLFSKLNLLSNYTQVKEAKVKVVDMAGKPIPNIQVDFMVYNYAEFYPFASFSTDNTGSCCLETGFGDLLVWVTDGSHYIWKVLPAEYLYPLEIVFDTSVVSSSSGEENLFLTPPSMGKIVIPESLKKNENERRLKEEDAIRSSYEDTFPDTASLREQYKNECFGEAMVNFILKSRGNYMQIATFYERAEDKETAIDLLSVISEKDLRDTPFEILLDHLRCSENFSCSKCPGEIFIRYVLSPRIGRELLSSWRSELQASFSKKEIKSFRKNPENLVAWINSNIKLDTENNYYGVTLFPGSVTKLRTADEYSRNVFFVACCRSFGIPARLEPATYIPQYYWQGKWIPAFPKEILPEAAKGRLILTNSNSFIPKYSIHFSIAKLLGGHFETLDYEYDKSLLNFPCTLKLDAGTYRLMTGNRQSDGSVLTRWSVFKISDGLIVSQPITFNEQEFRLSTLFNMSTEIEVTSLDNENKLKLKDLITAKGTVVALIDPFTEPGRHFLAELQPVADDFEKWGGNILMILPKESDRMYFSPATWKDLPKNSQWLYDDKSDLQNEIKEKTGKESSLPEVIFVTQAGDVFYCSRGYQVNTAQMILKIIRLLE